MRFVRSVVGFLASTVVGASIVASPAVAADDYNTYRVVGLPVYLTAPEQFTVIPDGPVAVCAMHFAGTVLTSPPWTFTADVPDHGIQRMHVQVDPCSGFPDFVPITLLRPVIFRTPAVFIDGLAPTTLQVTNNMGVPVTLTLTDPKDKPVGLYHLPADRVASEDLELRVPQSVLDSTAAEQIYTLTAVGSNGVRASAPLIVARGWAVFPYYDSPLRWKFPPCSTVTWSYDDTRQPASAKDFKRDVVAAFGRLHAQTGLRFVEVTGEASLELGWKAMGRGGPSGEGGTDGHVVFNTQDAWPTDLFAGFNAVHGRPADRGWQIVHELMHTLGFDHVPGRASIMTPVNYGQHRFSHADLVGLHTLYPQADCPVR